MTAANYKVLLSAWLVAYAHVVAAAADAEPAKTPIAATLRLVGGDRVAGRLEEQSAQGTIGWKCEGFVDPLVFPIASVDSVHFPLPEAIPQLAGEYCAELSSGDLLAGTLISLDSEAAVLEVAGQGPLRIARSALDRLYPLESREKTELIYFGPNGLEGWQTARKSPAWREEGGRLVADENGATLRRDLGLPALVSIEISLTWRQNPDFIVDLAIAPLKPSLRSFRLEVWGDELVAVTATDRAADVASIQKIDAAAGRTTIQVLLDQQKSRMTIFSTTGVRMAEVSVPNDNPQTLGGFQIINKHGDLKLETLRVTRWSGAMPRDGGVGKPRIVERDGTVTPGTIQSYDRAAGQFLTQTDEGEKRVDASKISDIFFDHEGEPALTAVRAVHLSGLRVSGKLLKIEQNQVWLECPGVHEPVHWPIDALQGLVVLDHPEEPPTLSGRRGRLELGATVLSGCLVDSEATAGGTLVWQPATAAHGSRLAHDAAATIVYRDPPVALKPVPSARRPAVRPFAVDQRALQRLRAQATTGTTAPTAKASAKQVLHLRSGDTIECSVSHIDESGITLSTPVSDVTLVRHDQVKVLELAPDVAPASILKSKKERLLTLPRMQRNNPPTQLLRSMNGDYLRARIVEMDENKVQCGVHLETKTIPRDTIARIIWLHADEVDRTPSSGDQHEPARQTRVQAIPSTGNRLTFVAEKMEGKSLAGRSEVLGDCHVDLETIDRLLIGHSIDLAADELAFHGWRMKPAPDPLEVPEGDGGEQGEGFESVLVGKPAPEFELGLLNGKMFRLADQKGKIVVLDFWASWCGPCLQVMPQVDKVTREFSDQGVVLVAVNLEESSDRVRAALARLQLETTVALDQNGRVAEKYGASAIPHTVIVDRSGKVARVFTGGGSQYETQLRAAIQDVDTHAEARKTPANGSE